MPQESAKIQSAGPAQVAVHQAATRKVPPVPPRPVLRAVVAMRDFLTALVRKMAPPPVAMAEFLFCWMNAPMVNAACRLNVADHLAGGPKTLEELVKATGAHQDSLARLMRALISLGIFARDRDGRYRLNPLGQTLRTGVPGSMRELAMAGGDKWHVAAWGAFPETVRTGRNGVELEMGKQLFEYLEGTPEGARFDGAMLALTQLDAPAHARAYNWSAHRRVCDVAGGLGTLLVHVLAQHPKLEGILFDLPHVVARARPNLEAWGVSDRVQTVGGSFFEAVPEGCDLYMMRDIIHDWDDDRSVAILKTIRKAMPPSSKLLIAEMVMTEDDGPFLGKLLDLQMMAITPEGKQRTPAEFRALFDRSGFRLSRVIPTSSPFSLVEALPV